MNAPHSYRFMATDFHLLKRKTAKGKTVYYVGFLSETPGKNGKRTYTAVRSTGVGNRSAAEKVAREMLQEGSVLASRDGLREYLISFWDETQSEYLRSRKAEGASVSASYCRNNRQRIRQYFLPYFERRGMTRLSELNRKNLTEWRNYLFEHGRLPEYEPEENPEKPNRRGEAKRPGRIAPSTQNKVRKAVFVALQWAVDMGKLPYHPGQGVKRVHEQRSERRIFEVSELDQLFAGPWEDTRAYAAALLAATTGARLGEVRGLLIQNAHLKERYVDILTNWVDSEGLKRPKWGSERIGVPIPDMTAVALEAVLKLNPYRKDPGAFLFFTPYSKAQPMDTRVITKALEKRMKAVGLPGGRSFHSFRHTYVSHLRGKLPESKLIRMVGHTSTAMSDEYTHTSEDDREAVRMAVSDFISRRPSE